MFLSACGTSTSGLPQNCQDVFKRWDELIVKLEANSNIPSSYVQQEKEERSRMLKLARKIETQKQTGICEFARRAVDEKLQALASGPDGLNEHIKKMEIMYNRKYE
ncbi:hypothetical protein BHC48_05285 [Snodgrassella communis]|uniref:Uncharacterized protein n=2 Tax=Snodgrassella TaxID=1193515 RepID=A0A2N9XQW0_9NEIS|nr:hypothetical protein BHC48_05285 [Snodgrassella communis]